MSRSGIWDPLIIILACLRPALRRGLERGHPAPRQGTLSPAPLIYEWMLVWLLKCAITKGSGTRGLLNRDDTGQSCLLCRNDWFFIHYNFLPQVTRSFADVNQLQFFDDCPQFSGCCHNNFSLLIIKLNWVRPTSIYTSSTLQVNAVQDVFFINNVIHR